MKDALKDLLDLLRDPRMYKDVALILTPLVMGLLVFLWYKTKRDKT